MTAATLPKEESLPMFWNQLLQYPQSNCPCHSPWLPTCVTHTVTFPLSLVPLICTVIIPTQVIQTMRSTSYLPMNPMTMLIHLLISMTPLHQHSLIFDLSITTTHTTSFCSSCPSYC